MPISPTHPPPRQPSVPVPWFGWACIALAGFAAWLVVHLSAEKSLIKGRLATELAQADLPDSIRYVQDHTFVVVVGVVLAFLLWATFRTPRSR